MQSDPNAASQHPPSDANSEVIFVGIVRRYMIASIRTLVLLLFLTGGVATVAVGVVSYSRGIPGNTILIPHHPRSDTPLLHVAMINGTLHLVREKATAAQPARRPWPSREMRLGPFYVKSTTILFVEATGVGMPFWAPAALLLAGPAVALIRGPIRRRRRRKRGECIDCGYNLHGLPEPRCPECGTPFEAKPEKPA